MPKQTLLEELSAELAKIGRDDYILPDRELNGHDYVAGKAHEEAKKLWTISQSYAAKAASQTSAMLLAKTPGERVAIEKTKQELLEKAKMARELFWLSVKQEFDLWNCARVTLNADFIITYESVGPKSFIEELLAGAKNLN